MRCLNRGGLTPSLLKMSASERAIALAELAPMFFNPVYGPFIKKL